MKESGLRIQGKDQIDGCVRNEVEILRPDKNHRDSG